MTLKDCVMQTSFEEVAPEMRRVLHGYRTPCTPEKLQRFCLAYERLKNIVPVPQEMMLSVVHCEVFGYYDKATYKKLKEKDPHIWEYGYGIGLTPWAEILGMAVDEKTRSSLSPEAIVANCLYEMLFYGTDEDKRGLREDIVEENNNEKCDDDNTDIVVHRFENGVATILDGTTVIPKCYFEGASSVESVIIPESVTYIGERAFRDCDNLKSVVLPNSLTIMKEGLFDGCSKLTSIVIPESVTLIERDVFYGCDSLEAVHIPQKVEEIMPGQFEGCDSIISITVDKKNPNYDSREGCNAIIETKTNTLIAGCNKSVIPSTVEEIFDDAFSGCSMLCSITIPNSVIRIEDGAFAECHNLTEIEIPESVQYIGNEVFGECSKLKSVVIKGKDTKLRDRSFGNSPIQSILVPKGTIEQYKAMLADEVRNIVKEQI